MSTRLLIEGISNYRIAGETEETGGYTWVGRLLNAPELESKGKESPNSGDSLRQISFSIANLKDDGTKFLDTTVESLWNKAVTLAIDGVPEAWVGTIKAWNVTGAGVLEITAIEDVLQAFKLPLPDEVVRLGDYSDASSGTLWTPGTNTTIPMVIGGAAADPIRVRGILVDKVNFRYMFCVGEIRQVVKVYKDRTEVSAGITKYTGSAGQAVFPGFAYVEFAADPRDSAGRWPEVYADIVGLKLGAYTEAECRNPARILYYLLITPRGGACGWGLGLTAGKVDSTTFNQAISDCDSIGLKCDGIMGDQKDAVLWIDEILKTCRGTRQNNGGKVKIWVDQASASVATFTEENMVLENYGKGDKQDRKNLHVIDYRYDATDGALLGSQTREDGTSQADIGLAEHRETALLIRDHVTAGFIADYWNEFQKYSENRIEFLTRNFAGLAKGSVITVTYAAENLTAAKFRIVNITYLDDGYQARIEARSYSDSIFSTSGGSSTTDPTPDPLLAGPESMTPPAIPTTINLTTGTQAQTDGTILGYVEGTYTPGLRTLSVNIEIGEGAVPASWRTVTVDQAGWFRVNGLLPGQLYTFRLTPHNTGGAGTPATSAITVSTDTTPPGKPVTPIATVHFKAVRVICYQNLTKAADLAGFRIYRNTTNNSGTATEIGFQACKGNEDAAAYFDSGAAYGIQYYYWTKAVDSSANLSVFSDVVTINTAYVESVDITANQIVGKDFRTATDVGNGAVSGIKFNADAIEGWNGATKNFCLKATDGTLYAQNANITGTMCANAGQVGGFTIKANCLHAGTGAAGVGMQSITTAGCIAFYAGCETPGSAPFRVTNQGALTATSGAIAGWTLAANVLSSGSGTCAAGIQSLTGAGCVAIYAGCSTATSAPFRVTNQGCLTATSATIAGTVCASAGYFCSCIYAGAGCIAGWSLTTCKICAGDVGMDSCATAGTVAFYAGCSTPGSAPFRVTNQGCLVASSAIITGTICATAGYFCSCVYAGAGCIAGWSLTACKICAGNVGMDSCATAGTVAFYAGCSTPGSAPFRVTNQGCLVASSAIITGTICATAGYFCSCIYAGAGCIGGWTIGADCICSAGLVLHSNGGICSTNYASGLRGWRVDCLGNAEFLNAVIRGELHSSIFTYDEIHAVGGIAQVANAGELLADATTAAAGGCCYYLCLKDPPIRAAVFSVNDVVRAKTLNGSNIYDVWGVVTAVNDCTTYYRYTIRHCSGTCGAVLPRSSAVVSYGPVSTGGGIILNGQGAESPYIDIFLNTACPWACLTPKVRLGQLHGITGADEYGLWTNNGKIVGGYVQSTCYDATHGSCIDLTMGTFKFGSCNAPKLCWDGATLQVCGTVYATAGTFTGTVCAGAGCIGGWLLAADALSNNCASASYCYQTTLSPWSMSFRTCCTTAGKYDGALCLHIDNCIHLCICVCGGTMCCTMLRPALIHVGVTPNGGTLCRTEVGYCSVDTSGWVRAGSCVSASGMVCAGTCVVGAYLYSSACIISGTYVQSGSYLCASTYIAATTCICAGTTMAACCNITTDCCVCATGMVQAGTCVCAADAYITDGATGTLQIGPQGGWADDGTYFCKMGTRVLYITSGTPTTYIYSASIYLGAGASGTTVYMRCTHLSGCGYCLNGATGAFCASGLICSSASICAGTFVDTAAYITSGTQICAGSYVQATTYLCAGSCVSASGMVCAGTCVVGAYLYSSACIISGTYIQSGSYLCSSTYIDSGACILSETQMCAKTYIQATTYLCAGSYVASTTYMSATTCICAGTTLAACCNITTDCCVCATGMLCAGTNVTAGSFVCATTCVASPFGTFSRAANCAVVALSSCCWAIYACSTGAWGAVICSAGTGGAYIQAATAVAICAVTAGCYGIQAAATGGRAVAGNGAYYDTTSSRSLKLHKTPLRQGILDSIRDFDIYRWIYADRAQTGFDEFIGPMAEDFNGAFALHFDEGIFSASVAGVALGGVKELEGCIQKQQECIQVMEARLANLESIITKGAA